MKVFSNNEFYHDLEKHLPASTQENRNQWAATIIQKNASIKKLSGLLKNDPKIVTRFLWLLSDIGIQNPKHLFSELPFLFNVLKDLNPLYRQSLASYWRIAGVPAENEAAAIELLFQWVLSNKVNTTIKSRGFFVLFDLTKKYPELKNELIICLNDQMDKHSKDFRKKLSKMLTALTEN